MTLECQIVRRPVFGLANRANPLQTDEEFLFEVASAPFISPVAWTERRWRWVAAMDNKGRWRFAGFGMVAGARYCTKVDFVAITPECIHEKPPSGAAPITIAEAAAAFAEAFEFGLAVIRWDGR